MAEATARPAVPTPSSTAASGIARGRELLGQQPTHAVADHDRRLADAVVGVERDGEALVDAGAGEDGVVGGFATGQGRGVHGVARGFEDSRVHGSSSEGLPNTPCRNRIGGRSRIVGRHP